MTNGSGAHEAAFVGQFLDLLLGQLTADQVFNIGGHADMPEEAFHGRNALQGSGFLVAIVVGQAEDIHSQLGKAGWVFLIHIACPAAPNGCQACPVGYAEHTAELMLQLVAGPVAQGSVAGDAVVGEGTAPHDFGPRIVILGLLQGDFRVAHNIAQQSCGDIVYQSQLLRLLAGEITLQSVDHDVGTAAGGLVGGQRIGQLRVQQGEFSVAVIGGKSTLEHALVLGNHGGVAHLAAGGSDGQHDADGRAACNFLFASIVIPDIALIG